MLRGVLRVLAAVELVLFLILVTFEGISFPTEVVHIKVSFDSKCSTRVYILTFLGVVLYRVESFIDLVLGTFSEVEFVLLGVVLVLET